MFIRLNSRSEEGEVMGKIHQLDSHLTNMIAAGEVVERPMGVIKELVENAIDAKATVIDVHIIEGGLASMRVVDNGEGMDREDATMAFLRHSTSKIRTEEDLWTINSLGFRGEALPSIASVSECVCITNNKKEATKVTIHYGKFIEAIPYDSEIGTSIEVKGLFLKTPARLKHMKSLPYEQALVVDVMQRFAISHPNIAFSLTADDKQIFATSGNGDVVEVIYRLYGKDIAKQTITITNNDNDFSLYVVLVKPQISRATRKDMFVYLNTRMVKSTRVLRAVSDGFRHFIPSDRYPIAFVFVNVDLKLVDVNVHPSKWEVRLSKEKQLFDLIEKTVHQALVQTPQIKQTRAFKTSYDTSVEQSAINFEPITNQSAFIFEDTSQDSDYTKQDSEPTVTKNYFNVLGQLHKKYILAENQDGLYIFDQHASMERVRYEYFKSIHLEKTHNQQSLLVPIVINNIRAIQQAEQLIELFKQFQIHVEQFHEQALIIRTVPQWISNTDEQKAINDIVEYFENNQNKTEEDLRKKVLSSLACHSSIRFNDYLSVAQMQQIVNDLMQCEQPYHCPHGRPTYIKLSSEDLKKEFLR